MDETASGSGSWTGDLARILQGGLDLSPLARRLYSQDASVYEERPLGVAYPRTASDCSALVRIASAHRLPLIPRGGGTSLAGQCVGSGLVVDLSRHLTAVRETDPAGGRARVEPGVVQDDLNDRLAPHGMMFAPDTSTSRQATIGGMIGNNSCGAYSILFGTTRDHVLAADVVLADGTPVRFSATPPAELDARRREDSPVGRIHRGLFDLVGRHREAILADYPRPAVVRRNTGYALDWLARCRPWNPDGPDFNLAPFLCGSEGTLALVTEAEVRIVPRPRHKRVVAAHFASVDEACRATLVALEHRPAAAEIMDGTLLEATRNNREQAANRVWIEGAPGAVLAVEVWDDDERSVVDRARALADDLGVRGRAYARPILPAREAARVWAIRKAGLGLLTGIPGDAKPATAIEDMAVAVEDLPAFVRDVEDLMRRHDLGCVYYGHASVGLIHFRPMLNLKDPGDLAKFQTLLGESARLCRRYGGSFSGEHGDGRLRAPYLRESLSPRMHDLCVEVKRLFDPRGILNPGKIVDAPPAVSSLRTPVGRPVPEIGTEFDWSRTLGLVRAAEACNGAGFCRQAAGRGLMCPSFMATGDEAHSTRGRANVLRQMLDGDDPARAWCDADLARVMDTCLSCKGCAGECPSSVDMARLKAEWLQKRMDRRGPSLRSLAFGYFATFARLARGAPALASRLMNAPALKRLLGVAAARPIPPYARQTLAAWFRARPDRPQPNGGREAVLFNDEFTNYTEPEVGICAVELLEAAGFRVRLTCGLESGRTQISKGFLRAARRRLVTAVGELAPFARRGVPVIGLEPSALLTFRDEAPDLVPAALRDAAAAVKAQALLFEEFWSRLAESDALRGLLKAIEPRHVLFHGHCHQKALAGTACTVEALKTIPGLEVTEVASGCCGMAGSFGYEAEHYELSQRVAELILFPAIRAHPDAWICAPGTSCRSQIRDGTGRTAFHPAVLLHRALK